MKVIFYDIFVILKFLCFLINYNAQKNEKYYNGKYFVISNKIINFTSLIYLTIHEDIHHLNHLIKKVHFNLLSYNKL